VTARPNPAPGGAARRRRRADRAGVAILMVVTAIALCLVLVNDFGTRTQVDKLGARNNLDQVRAHFLARSGLNLADLMLRLQKKIEQFEDQLGPIQLTTYADTFIAAFGGDAEQVEGAVGVSLGETKGLGVSFGSFGVRMTPVDGKINVNCAASQAASNTRVVRSALQGLLFPNAFDPVFEEEDAEGWRRDRATQIDAIMDYIDKDQDRGEQRAGAEDYGYENLKDRYKPKNNAIDSVAELKLVRGVDARFWALFGTAFRTLGACEVNLRVADDPKILLAVIQLAAKVPEQVDLGNAWQLAQLWLQAVQLGLVQPTNDEFRAFIADPKTALAPPTGEAGATPTSATPTPTLTVPPNLVGVELVREKLNAIAKAGPARVYEVEVYGEVARGGALNPLRRTIRGTWDQEFRMQESRVAKKFPPGKNNGTWLYLREE
jgi:hypothetical protein